MAYRLSLVLQIGAIFAVRESFAFAFVAGAGVKTRWKTMWNQIEAKTKAYPRHYQHVSGENPAETIQNHVVAHPTRHPTKSTLIRPFVRSDPIANYASFALSRIKFHQEESAPPTCRLTEYLP
jgi:hypothetical protein